MTLRKKESDRKRLVSRYFDYVFVGNFQTIAFVDYYEADENSRSSEQTYTTNPLEDLSKIVSNVGRRRGR